MKKNKNLLDELKDGCPDNIKKQIDDGLNKLSNDNPLKILLLKPYKKGGGAI